MHYAHEYETHSDASSGDDDHCAQPDTVLSIFDTESAELHVSLRADIPFTAEHCTWAADGASVSLAGNNVLLQRHLSGISQECSVREASVVEFDRADMAQTPS